MGDPQEGPSTGNTSPRSDQKENWRREGNNGETGTSFMNYKKPATNAVNKFAFPNQRPGGPNFSRGGRFPNKWERGPKPSGNWTKSNDYKMKPKRIDQSSGSFAKSIGFVFLQNLINADAEKIILELIKEREGFLRLLENDLSCDALVLVIKILKKVSSSAFSNAKVNILHSTLNEKFINKLHTFIACLPAQDQSQKRHSLYFWKEPSQLFADLLEICEDLLHTMPTFAYKSLPMLLNSLKIYVPLIEQMHNIKIDEKVKKYTEKQLLLLQTITQENEEKHKSLQKQTEESSDPPDDFRNIGVYPSAEEIVGGRGFIRENVIHGSYQNVNHYLDVQFRLLREDFVGPLRDGIASFRAQTPTNESVRVHKGVHFLNTETINEYYCLRVQFSSKKRKIANFENSRRFMYGALLCFTNDNFQSLIFGKVAQRKVEDLEKGQLIVAFDEKLVIDYHKTYLMVECNVYFEPYFHVLTVLKQMTEENFPMERYIVRVNHTVLPPEYLTLPDYTYEIEGHEFNPLEDWPNESFYGLNESQMVAFKAAITQEIAVIQGPPGTGKTYLGLKIAETLLRNIECWYNETPMLVICFTNHALDQFLEGLIPLTRRIVRVGGQSKNTNLDIYNLRNKNERDYTVAAKRREVQDCLRTIKQMMGDLEQMNSYNSVIDFLDFCAVDPEFEDSWFATARSVDLAKWLLQGARYGSSSQGSRHKILDLQAQIEFFRIGINDDFVDVKEQTRVDVVDEFNDRFISNIDSIFEEAVKDYEPKRRNQTVSLSLMREQLKYLDDALRSIYELENPSFDQRIQYEQMFIEREDVKQKYEYLKHNLSEGRERQNIVDKPEHIDLTRPYNIRFEDRWRLYFYWLNLYKKHESDILDETCKLFPKLYKEYEEMRQIEDVRTMKNALVVGMTTTSAARLRSSLQTLKNPVVIVEEAAEVLEAHIVTSITKHCKHLILIGDHKQLRPNTANYSMEKKYRLGISLFERMIINNIHCFTLNVQHRMRPEISSLITPAIYDFLEDHPSVLRRPHIVGIDKSVFFIDHDHPEESCEDSSKINLHEVNFLIYLARHLVLNGYNAEKITILAAYLGQFFEFKKAKKENLDLLDGMKIAVLDNYQGEESDIILLSLVRNNEENKIGFLAIENRVCVALSRARNGLYVMGNMNQLCSDNKLWNKIKDTLEKQNALGKELPLRCQIHQDQITPVKCDQDFFSVCEGGCNKRCDMDLKCGHKCTSLCHIRDRGHLSYKCQENCNKPLCNKDDSHICKKMCFEDCGLCTYLVERTLKCGHEVRIPCHVDPDAYKCQIKVPTVLPCGHQTDKPCYCDPENFMCPHICDVQVQPCGHACELLCHIRRDPQHLEYECKKPCTKFMKNCSVQEEDHRCRKMCYQECDPCTLPVRKRRTVCPHLYDVACNYDVDELVCEKPCSKTLKCGHPCKGRCNEPCKLCQFKVNKVLPICGHSVKIKCCEPPNRKFCNKRCPLKLPCGHFCTNKCNEPCTSKCMELVDCSGITAECGHLVTRMECYMNPSCVDEKLLMRNCTEPCGKELKCGHRCLGACGDCLQGRVHKRCTEKCGAMLVCDHQCNFPCRQACRPCKRICEYRCQHSACRKSCGEVCTPCKERCSRKCKHQWCTKFCGEICNVDPCTEPCVKKLKCGHPCVGFCGDPCPPKCMICNRDELLDIFFGTESEDARYVLLNDCKHIVEHTGMEQWLRASEEQISFKVCPKCKTAIRTTQRYSDYIKQAIKDIAQVKMKTNGRPKEIEERRNEILLLLKQIQTRCKELQMYCPGIAKLVKDISLRVSPSKKGKRLDINISETQSLKAKLQLLENIVDVCCSKEVHIQTSKEIFFPQVNFLLTILCRDADYITAQEIEDVTWEINRLSRIVEFSCLQKVPQFRYYSTSDENVKGLIATIEKHIFACKRFTNENNNFLKICLAELNDAMKSAIAISDQERKEILQAMGFSKGHWFKCPNGHVYAIGECGGAMEEATCNECGAKIGGRNHRLLNDNAVATEMDGAVYGAYSARANLQNYDLAYLQNVYD